MDELAWRGIRDQFRLDPDVLHFGAFWLSSYPDPVRAAIDGHRLGIDRNPVYYILDNEERFERETRAALGTHIGADPDRIVLTGSTTEALALTLGALSINASDEILITEHEHYSAYSAASRLRERSGGHLRTVALYGDPSEANAEAMLAALVEALRPETRIVAVTWVHSNTGVRIPLSDVAQMLAALNAGRSAPERILLCVDGTHGFGALRFDAQESPCDIFASSCHKWLNGPHGTGFAYVSHHADARAEWLIPSFAPGPLGRFTGRVPASEAPWERLTPGGFHAFENRWSIPAATAFADAIGQEQIEARIGFLADRLKTAMAAMPRIRMITPRARNVSAGIVCFEVEGLTPLETVAELRRRAVVASVSPYRQAYARLTPGIYNTIDDIDILITRLAEL